MQTFLPYKDFKKTAKCLDYKRLGKQRVECWQLIQAIEGKTKGWRNHPAAKMWKNNIGALINYAIEICNEWRARNYKDSMLERFIELKKKYSKDSLPFWFNDDRLFSSHRSNLLRKDSGYYKSYGWVEDDSLPYFWPAS